MTPIYKRTIYTFLILVIGSLVLTSCEDIVFLPSKKKIKKDIAHIWKRDFLGIPVSYDEEWRFNQGSLYIVKRELYSADTIDNGLPDKNPTDNADTLDIANYSIDTKIFKAFVKISGFSVDSSLIEYNTKWQIIELDKTYLFIAGDRPSGKGLMQREFDRVD